MVKTLLSSLWHTDLTFYIVVIVVVVVDIIIIITNLKRRYCEQNISINPRIFTCCWNVAPGDQYKINHDNFRPGPKE